MVRIPDPPPGLEQAECGRAIQTAAVGEPPFTAFEAARLIRIGSYLEQTARGLKPESGELPGEALNE